MTLMLTFDTFYPCHLYSFEKYTDKNDQQEKTTPVIILTGIIGIIRRKGASEGSTTSLLPLGASKRSESLITPNSTYPQGWLFVFHTL